MRNSMKPLLATVLLVCASIGGASSAYAAEEPGPGSLTPDELRSHYTDEELFYTPEITGQPAETGSGATESITLRGASYLVACTVKANAPHISAGAGGVIYKTRVNCTGEGAYPSTVYIQVKAALYHIPADSPTDTDDVNWQSRFESAEGRSMVVNGATETFYVPWEGLGGKQGKGFWQGTSIVDITDPVGFKSGNDTSAVYFLDTTAG